MSAQDRADAYEMIAEEGQTITLTRDTLGAHNPATGAPASSGPVTQTGKGVILPLSAGVKYLGGTNIPKGAKQCLLAGLATDGTDIEPMIGDLLTAANGDKYTVAEIGDLDPDSAGDILYDLTIVGAQ